MGDFSAHLDLKMTLLGKTYTYDASINYSGYGGVDHRVIGFFEDSWNDAWARYEQERIEREEDANRINMEKDERALLARLKQKYES